MIKCDVRVLILDNFGREIESFDELPLNIRDKELSVMKIYTILTKFEW